MLSTGKKLKSIFQNKMFTQSLEKKAGNLVAIDSRQVERGIASAFDVFLTGSGIISPVQEKELDSDRYLKALSLPEKVLVYRGMWESADKTDSVQGKRNAINAARYFLSNYVCIEGWRKKN